MMKEAAGSLSLPLFLFNKKTGRPLEEGGRLCLSEVLLVFVQEDAGSHLVHAALHVLKQGGVLLEFRGLGCGGSFTLL